MAASPVRLPTVIVHASRDKLEEANVLPWFSYQVPQPSCMLPVAERPHMSTSRLLVRPLTVEDAGALYKLRKDPKLQYHSNLRGGHDPSLRNTVHSLEKLQNYDGDYTSPEHWYFGAFLADTGELIGEGGLPDIQGNTRSGWPEIDFLIARPYQRQGYGTEFFNVVMRSWWNLPRERRRRQLHPFVVPGVSPGAKLADSVVVSYEADNKPAEAFFAKMAGAEAIAMKGTVEDYDSRERRQGALTKWSGFTLTSPVLFVDEDMGGHSDSESEGED